MFFFQPDKKKRRRFILKQLFIVIYQPAQHRYLYAGPSKSALDVKHAKTLNERVPGRRLSHCTSLKSTSSYCEKFENRGNTGKRIKGLNLM